VKSTFIVILAAWTVVAVHHLVRLVKRRHPLSGAAAIYPLGWAAFAAREAHLLSLDAAHWLTSAALVLGMLCAGLCLVTSLAEWLRT
jgi:hypothetical protein